MGMENAVQPLSFPVAQNSAALQYRFMTLNSSGQLATTGDGGDADGVLQDDPDTIGNPGCLAAGGQVKVEAGGTCTAGGYAGSDSVGRAVDAASGDYILGRFVEGTTNAGEIVSIIFTPGHATL